MVTAMLTAENIATGSKHDVWNVNVEEEYHEESSTDDSARGARGTGRDAPVNDALHPLAWATMEADRESGPGERTGRGARCRGGRPSGC